MSFSFSASECLSLLSSLSSSLNSDLARRLHDHLLKLLAHDYASSSSSAFSSSSSALFAYPSALSRLDQASCYDRPIIDAPSLLNIIDDLGEWTREKTNNNTNSTKKNSRKKKTTEDQDDEEDDDNETDNSHALSPLAALLRNAGADYATSPSSSSFSSSSSSSSSSSLSSSSSAPPGLPPLFDHVVGLYLLLILIHIETLIMRALTHEITLCAEDAAWWIQHQKGGGEGGSERGIPNALKLVRWVKRKWRLAREERERKEKERKKKEQEEEQQKQQQRWKRDTRTKERETKSKQGNAKLSNRNLNENGDNNDYNNNNELNQDKNQNVSEYQRNFDNDTDLSPNQCIAKLLAIKKQWTILLGQLSLSRSHFVRIAFSPLTTSSLTSSLASLSSLSCSLCRLLVGFSPRVSTLSDLFDALAHIAASLEEEQAGGEGAGAGAGGAGGGGETQRRWRLVREKYQRPNHLWRHATTYMGLAATCVAAGYFYYKHANMLTEVRASVKNTTNSIYHFTVDHLIVPAQKIYVHVFDTFAQRRIHSEAEQSLNATKQALIGMLSDYARNQSALTKQQIVAASLSSPSSADTNSTLDVDAQLNSLVEQGDMNIVMTKYRDMIQSPIFNAFAQDLLQAFLIQIQKVKVQSEEALMSLDQILSANEINFNLMSTVPALMFIYGSFLVGRWTVQRVKSMWSRQAAASSKVKQTKAIIQDMLLLTISQLDDGANHRATIRRDDTPSSLSSPISNDASSSAAASSSSSSSLSSSLPWGSFSDSVDSSLSSSSFSSFSSSSTLHSLTLFSCYSTSPLTHRLWSSGTWFLLQHALSLSVRKLPRDARQRIQDLVDLLSVRAFNDEHEHDDDHALENNDEGGPRKRLELLKMIDARIHTD